MTIPEGLEAALNFRFMDAIFTRRSRRFGLGMEIKEGTLAHKSRHVTPVHFQPPITKVQMLYSHPPVASDSSHARNRSRDDSVGYVIASGVERSAAILIL